MEQLEKNIVREDIKRAVIEKYENQVEGVNGALQKLKAEGIPTDLPTLKRLRSVRMPLKAGLTKLFLHILENSVLSPLENENGSKNLFTV